MTPRSAPACRSVRTGTLCCLAMAVSGVVLLTVGLAHRSAPLAAPLPPTPAPVVLTGPPTRTSHPAMPSPAIAPSPGESPPVARRSPQNPSRSRPHSDLALDAHPLPPVALGPNTLSIPVLAQPSIAIRQATETGDLTLEPPADVHTVGIWSPGAPLSATAGTTDIVGHVNYAGQGPGALHDIADLRSGDLLYTTDNRGRTTSWTVTTVVARTKNTGVAVTAFPGPAGPRQLVLITCGGAFDPYANSYVDNVYVRARPTPANRSAEPPLG